MAREGKIIETWVHPKYKERVDIRLDKKTGEFGAEYGEHRLRSLELPKLRDDLRALIDRLWALEWVPMIEVSCEGSARCTIQQPIRPGMTETVDEDEPDRQEEGKGELNITFSRSWIAQQPNGAWLQCKQWFSVDEQNPENAALIHDEKVFFTCRPMARRLNARDFYLANRLDNGRGFALPYTVHDNYRVGNQADVHYVPYTQELWDGLNELVARVDQLKNRLQDLLGKEAGRLRLAGLVNRFLTAGPE